jgi:RIO kinase 2
MISIDHPNAKEYFERDVECIKTFFSRRFRFEADGAPKWEDVKREGKLDFEVKASGYGGKLEKEMEWYHREISVATDNQRIGRDEDEEEEDEVEEEEDESLQDEDEIDESEGKESDGTTEK